MKKIFVALTALGVLLLASCGKKIDSSTWIDNYADAQKVAQKSGKNMLVYFSALDYNPMSKAVYENVLSKDDFTKKYSNEFVLTHLDFSESLYIEAEADENASKSEKAAAAALKAKLDGNFKIVQYYDVREPIALLLLSKDGYFIKEFDLSEQLTLQDFDDYFVSSEAEITKFNEIVASAQKGSKEEKMQAIDTLFEITNPDRNYAICPFAEEYIKLDTENTSGKLFDYLQVIAFKNAVDHLISEDIKGAAEEFAKVAENNAIKPEEKQAAYISAAYYLVSSGYTDYSLMKDYFERAYTAAPESEISASILSSINQLEKLIAGFAEGADGFEGASANSVAGE